MIARRAFLGGLVRLPLVGGAVGLIGAPTAVAEPVTRDLLEAYKTWLDHEKRFLCWQMAADAMVTARYRPLDGGTDRIAFFRAIMGAYHYVGKAGSYHHGPKANDTYGRAALVLSTVGCDWRERQR